MKINKYILFILSLGCFLFILGCERTPTCGNCGVKFTRESYVYDTDGVRKQILNTSPSWNRYCSSSCYNTATGNTSSSSSSTSSSSTSSSSSRKTENTDYEEKVCKDAYGNWHSHMSTCYTCGTSYCVEYLQYGEYCSQTCCAAYEGISSKCGY